MYYAFPLLAVVLWAGNTTVNKLTVGAINPTEIGFYRWLLAAIILTPFLLRPAIRSWSVSKQHAGKIFFLGFLGMAVYQSLAYFAAPKTSATNMGIIQSLMPLISLTLAIMTLGQRLTMGALVGSVVSFSGVLLVISGGSLSDLIDKGINMGDAMMLIATFSYAVYSILLKKWQIPLPAMTMLYWQVLVGVIVLFPVFWWSPKMGLDAQNIPLIIYACLFASIAAPLAWMTGIKHLGPSSTASFFNLGPVITAVIAWLILSEQLASYHFIGGGMTILGVIISERWTRPWRAVKS